MCRSIVLILFTLMTNAASAQPSNLSMYQDLAVACLGEVPSGRDSLILEGPDRMPYLRSELISHWQNAGSTIFLADSAAAHPALATLSIHVDDAGVEYARSGRRQLTRKVNLGLRYTLTDAGRRVVADRHCVDHLSDTIARSAVPDVEHEGFAETQGQLPQPGWFRRVLEPAILTGATAVAVYLFFVLRSERTADS